jgi:hypothetical protein
MPHRSCRRDPRGLISAKIMKSPMFRRSPCGAARLFWGVDAPVGQQVHGRVPHPERRVRCQGVVGARPSRRSRRRSCAKGGRNTYLHRRSVQDPLAVQAILAHLARSAAPARAVLRTTGAGSQCFGRPPAARSQTSPGFLGGRAGTGGPRPPPRSARNIRPAC